MPKLTALHPINHDGKDYAEGDTLTVDNPAQVAQLVDSGSAEVAGGRTRTSKPTKAELEAIEAQRQADEAEAEAQAQAAAKAQADAAAAGSAT